jgi:hypothetical protein
MSIPKPIHEFDVFGTRDDNPHLPLQLRLTLLVFGREIRAALADG